MTPRKAMYLCWQLWRRRPRSFAEKHDLARLVAGRAIYNSCPACEECGMHCLECLLRDLWTSRDNFTDLPCERALSSPYRLWRKAPNGRISDRCCDKIAEAARKKLQEVL